MMSEVFKSPDDPSGYIWRYMDFTKFMAMLESKSLYFPRADRLGDDKYECTFPRGNLKNLLNAINTQLERLNLPPERAAEKEAVYKNEIDLYVNATNKVRKTCFVSCWHMNQHESAAMWKLHLSQNEGIAIRSTTERLEKETENYRGPIQPGYPGAISIGEVKYIDYEEEQISDRSWLNFLMHKRISFKHEQELRAVYWGLDLSGDLCSKDGHNIKLNLNSLIDRVFVAPTAALWFKTLVENSIEKWGLHIEVEQSSLARSPLQ